MSSDAANRIDGRGGSDTVSYDLSARGQLINLAGGAATDGIFTDTLLSIENAIGSGLGRHHREQRRGEPDRRPRRQRHGVLRSLGAAAS